MKIPRIDRLKDEDPVKGKNENKARKNWRGESHRVNGRNDYQALQMLWTKVKLRSFEK